MFALN